MNSLNGEIGIRLLFFRSERSGIDMLLKAAKAASNDAISPVCLFQAAQVYEAEGENEKAVELYKEIKEKYFRSPVSADMDKYIERATK